MLISVKTTRLDDSQNGIKGLATVSFGDAFKVQSIAIKESKDGKLFVAMPSYKTKQVDEAGKAVYRDICNPITKDFREALYGAILSSFENGRDATIGEADGRTTPTVGVKTSVLENGGATKGLATIYLEDAFVVSNVAIKQSHEGKLFASMPSYKTSQVDEDGKPVYKDICYPATKEFREELQSAVVNTYLETQVGIEQPKHQIEGPGTPAAADSFMNIPEDEALPFDNGEKPKEEKTSSQKKDEKTKPKEADKEKPKSIKERLADGQAKKSAKDAIKADQPKTPKKDQVIA